jgi:hypothetical protein
MTIDQEIEFFANHMRRTRTKELALVCFGIKTGLEIARTKQNETLSRITRILEHVPGINDERDSVPILLAIKAEMEKLNA